MNSTTLESETAPIASYPTPTVEVNSDSGSRTTASGQDSLVQRLHTLEGTNPEFAVDLALEDRERFPTSPHAEERDMILVAALYNQRDILRAKDQAWYYFVHYPNGRYTEYLSRLTRLKPPAGFPHQ